jgi:hypothetical protein
MNKTIFYIVLSSTIFIVGCGNSVRNSGSQNDILKEQNQKLGQAIMSGKSSRSSKSKYAQSINSKLANAIQQEREED